MALEDRYELEQNVVQKKMRELLDSAAALAESKRRGGAETARDRAEGELTAAKTARMAAEGGRDGLRAEVSGLLKLGRRA